MADEKKFDYGILSSYGGKFYHRPGWAAYAEKVEAERRERGANAPVILRKKQMNAGGTRYTFSVIQQKNNKPYLKVSMVSDRMNYRGTICVSAPYVPTFVSMLIQLSKGLE